MVGVRSFEPELFRELEKLLEGPAAPAVLNAIENAQSDTSGTGGKPVKLDIGELARRLGRDERNVRDQVTVLERAVDVLAGQRLPVQFVYPKRGPGRAVELGLRAVCHRTWGNSEKLLLGFTGFTIRKARAVDLIILRRAGEPGHYTASLADLGFEMASLIQQSGVKVNRGHTLPRLRTHPNPVIILGSPRALEGQKFERPRFSKPRVDAPKPRSADQQFHTERVTLTRFMNRCNPPHPVLVIESSGEAAPEGLMKLLHDNATAGEVWSQLRLGEEWLPPDEYEFEIRFEIDTELNAVNGTGDPEVMQGFYFGRLEMASD